MAGLRLILEDGMKTPKVGLAFLTGALFLAGYFASTPAAFHSGGVAECAGCHSMHNPKEGGSFLLVGTDQSSTCLTCHQSEGDTGPNGYHVSTIEDKLGDKMSPLQRTPGGDFGWIKKNYAAGSYSEDGSTHGHNIVAVDFGYEADTEWDTAPGGGVFPSSMLGCASCHDPHGENRRLLNGTIAQAGGPIKASGSYYDNNSIDNNEPSATEAVGVYRLLGAAGYGQKGGGVTFAGVPAAKVNSTYNRTEASTQTRVAYGHATSGGHISWGKWCATCHPKMHSDGNYVHPIDETLGSEIALNYNQYVKTGDMTGTTANSFSSLVPFVENTADYRALAAHAVNTAPQPGPGSSDRVSCLSCHRAHASGMMYGLRFDIEYEFMTKAGNYIGSDNTAVTGSRAPQQHRGRTIAEWQAAYYDRPATQFATYQRVLCNKCHQKD
jgi:hypothetical protein